VKKRYSELKELSNYT